jgi:hypothetical protein
MKYVYLVEFRDLNRRTDRFELYRTEVYSSAQKALGCVTNVMDINGAYNIEDDPTYLLDDKELQRIDYSTIANTDKVHMRMRMIVTKTEVR